MGSFTLRSPNGPDLVINYSDDDFSTEMEALDAFMNADLDTQTEIVTAGDMAPYFERGLEGVGGFPELPQGSSRNKIEFLHGLMKSYVDGSGSGSGSSSGSIGVDMPNLRASFLTNGAAIGDNVPSKFGLRLDDETSHYLNADLYQSSQYLSFREPIRQLLEYSLEAGLVANVDFVSVAGGMLPNGVALGFGVTFYASLKFRVAGSVFDDVKALSGSERGSLVMSLGVSIGDNSFDYNVDKAPAYFYEDGGYGYLVVNAPFRYNFWLSGGHDGYDVEMKFKIQSQTGDEDGFYLSGDNVDFRECKFNVNVTDCWVDNATGINLEPE